MLKNFTTLIITRIRDFYLKLFLFSKKFYLQIVYLCKSNLLYIDFFSIVDKIKKEVDEESPESGIRDEGYSTMSSDVQGTSEMPHKALEELKEVTDETDSSTFRINSLDTKIMRFVRNSLTTVFEKPIYYCDFPNEYIF